MARGRKPDSLQATLAKTTARKVARETAKKFVKPRSFTGRIISAAIGFAVTEGSKRLGIK